MVRKSGKAIKRIAKVHENPGNFHQGLSELGSRGVDTVRIANLHTYCREASRLVVWVLLKTEHGGRKKSLKMTKQNHNAMVVK